MSAVTGISGIQLSAASAAYAPTNSADVSAIASAYATGKQDAITFGYDADDKISSIDGSALAGGEGGGLVTSIQTAQDPWYQQSISGLNGSSIYPKWAANASYAERAAYASQAASAASAAAAPTAWAALFISSVSSPSGTIRVLNNNEIEGTNSAVLPSTVVEGFSVVSSTTDSLTAFSFTVPTSNPNTQVIITGGWAYGNFGISGDNGVTAESSLAGYVNVTFDMPGATAFDVTSEAWVAGIGYTASALASEVGGGVGELAWASALPTYQYDAEDKISSINGSAIAGGAAGVDSATCSAIASSYAESAVSGKADSSALSSYALSADVSGTVNLVSTQSANWGGSALALSAGPGVKLEKVGDTLVASTDETVLFSGSNGGMVATNLTEPLSGFNSFKICFNPFGNGMSREWKEFSWAGSSDVYTVATFHKNGNDNLAWYAAFQPNTDGTTLTPIANKLWILGSTTVQDRTQMTVYRVVGINRTAEA